MKREMNYISCQNAIDCYHLFPQVIHWHSKWLLKHTNLTEYMYSSINSCVIFCYHLSCNFQEQQYPLWYNVWLTNRNGIFIVTFYVHSACNVNMVYQFLGKANWAMIVTVENAVCLSLPSVKVYESVFIFIVYLLYCNERSILFRFLSAST